MRSHPFRQWHHVEAEGRLVFLGGEDPLNPEVTQVENADKTEVEEKEKDAEKNKEGDTLNKSTNLAELQDSLNEFAAKSKQQAEVDMSGFRNAVTAADQRAASLREQVKTEKNKQAEANAIETDMTGIKDVTGVGFLTQDGKPVQMGPQYASSEVPTPKQDIPLEAQVTEGKKEAGDQAIASTQNVDRKQAAAGESPEARRA